LIFFKRNVSNISSFLFCRLLDEYNEPDSKMEVNGGGGVYLFDFFKSNISNISSFLFCRLPDKYNEPDFGMEVNGEEEY